MAPTARRTASSRVRWLTVIEKVLAIRKAPTISAVAAIASSMMRTMLSSVLAAAALAAAVSLLVAIS